jgi:hypothetical protein
VPQAQGAPDPMERHVVNEAAQALRAPQDGQIDPFERHPVGKD